MVVAYYTIEARHTCRLDTDMVDVFEGIILTAKGHG